MAKFRMLAPAWFRSAPLLLTMLALMAGIVGMHAWTGGLGAAAAAPEHGAVIQNDGGTGVHGGTAVDGGTGVHGGTAVSAGAPLAMPDHEGHESHGGAAIPPLETTSGAAGHSPESNTDCSEGCGGMTMLNCVMAFALLILTALIRPAILTLPRPTGLFRPIPLLLRTAAPIRGPSLVHLSISRT